LFTIPNTTDDLASFFRIQQALTKAIDTALIQRQASITPAQAAAQDFRPLRFGSSWRAGEIGVTTNMKNVSLHPAYGHKSFIDGIVPVENSAGQYYQVVNTTGAITSVVSPQPTTLPCVNTIMLAEATSAGTWLPPSYLLGSKEGEGWLVVDRCVDIAAPNTMGTLSPSASLYVAIQWADVEAFKHMRSDDSSASVMHKEGVVDGVGGAVAGSSVGGWLVAVAAAVVVAWW